MFEHIRKKLPWKTRGERKKEFVKHLRGNKCVRVLDVCNGATFTICNEVTGEIHSVVRVSGAWFIWGTTACARKLTNAELEDFLTEQTDIVTKLKKNLRIMDEFGCLEWLER